MNEETLTLADMQAAWPTIPDVCWVFDPASGRGVQLAIERGESPVQYRDHMLRVMKIIGCSTPRQERVREQLQTDDAVRFIAGLMGSF